MSKLIMLAGLPGSGKTTRAFELLKEYGNAVRVNRDALRAMLHNNVWSGTKEGITQEIAREVVVYALMQPGIGVVIVDDTNLGTSHAARWKQVAHDCNAGFQEMRMDTPLSQCIERDSQRRESVGRSVIIGMALQYGLYPKPAQGVVLCDIDGTLADCEHRRHYLQETPKNRQGFFDAMRQDTPRQEIVSLVQDYQVKGYEVFLVSGRPESHRAATVFWLLANCPGLVYEALFMRRTDDHRPDTVLKAEMLERYFPDPSWVRCAIDDRPSILRVWQEHGIETINVGDGQEF